jgi:hypothetical protein
MTELSMNKVSVPDEIGEGELSRIARPVKNYTNVRRGDERFAE